MYFLLSFTARVTTVYLCPADCSTCTSDYTTMLAYTCTNCLEESKQIALTVVVGFIALGICVMSIVYMVSDVDAWANRNDRCSKSLRFLKKVVLRRGLKTAIVCWQILTQASGEEMRWYKTLPASTGCRLVLV